MRMQGGVGDHRWQGQELPRPAPRHGDELGALAFLNPWLLAALATLPIIYWLLRTVRRARTRSRFRPTRILVGLENQERRRPLRRGG